MWTWFAENAWRLPDALDGDGILVEEITRVVRHVTDLDWELGPDRYTDQICFSLGPITERDLEEAREIVATAPELEGVVVRAGRPPKPWLQTFEFRGSEVRVED